MSADHGSPRALHYGFGFTSGVAVAATLSAVAGAAPWLACGLFIGIAALFGLVLLAMNFKVERR